MHRRINLCFMFVFACRMSRLASSCGFIEQNKHTHMCVCLCARMCFVGVAHILCVLYCTCVFLCVHLCVYLGRSWTYTSGGGVGGIEKFAKFCINFKEFYEFCRYFSFSAPLRGWCILCVYMYERIASGQLEWSVSAQQEVLIKLT